MARPTARKGTAHYLFRRRIPADIVRILDRLGPAYRPEGWGKKEITLTLGTADKRGAGAVHARIAADVERRFAALRAGERRLSQKEAVALAGLVYKAIAAGVEDDPGPASFHAAKLAANADARGGRYGLSSLIIGTAEERREASMNERFGPYVDPVLVSEGLIVDADSRKLLIREVARALDDAAAKLKRNAEGDYRPDLAAQRFPKWEDTRQQPRNDKLSLVTLFDRWADHPEQAEQARGTLGRYRGVFKALADFLNEPDARDVTAADMGRYIEARMANKGDGRLSPRTARDVHTAALSSVYAWAAAKRLVAGNPAAEIKIKVAKGRVLRSNEATDGEALALVNAALALPSTAAAGTLEAAKRWGALLCLYTGARVGEICQLRRSDIELNGRTPHLRITPEAGNVKSGVLRTVPLHPRLIELGFARFVEEAKDGPLFVDPTKRRKAEASTPKHQLVAREIAEWARTVALGDPLLKTPMHSLRHRFMTSCRRAGIDEQYIAAIVGHEPGNQNRSYGSYPADVLHRELSKLTGDVVEGRQH